MTPSEKQTIVTLFLSEYPKGVMVGGYYQFDNEFIGKLISINRNLVGLYVIEVIVVTKEELH